MEPASRRRSQPFCADVARSETRGIADARMALRSCFAASLLALAAVASGCAAEPSEDTATADSELTQRQITSFYRQWENRRASVVAAVVRAHGKPVEEMNDGQYAAFLATVDLAKDDGLMTWAAATGMSVVALTKDSNFFFYDAHLLQPSVGATLGYKDYSSMTRSFDEATRTFSFTSATGAPLATRTLKADAIRRTESASGLSYNAGFGEDRLHLDTLMPYLAPLSAVPNRADIAESIRSMPLFMVKTLRGKGLFLSTERGRSYAVTTPISNDIYSGFAGLVPGAFFEVNSPMQTRETLVHELCHVLDHTVLSDRYGSVLYPYRYPALVPFEAERDALFEPRPADTSRGFISAYAKTNAQEDFAEHCRAYVRIRPAFAAQAATEAAAGSDLLSRKLAFMEKVFAASPAFERLSPAIVASLGTSTPGGGGGTTTTCNGDAACQEKACLADLVAVKDVEARISEAATVTASCEVVSQPQQVPLGDGGHYYVGDVRCTFASDVPAAAQSAFVARMEAKSYYGYRLEPAGSGVVAVGQTSTRACASY